MTDPDNRFAIAVDYDYLGRVYIEKDTKHQSLKLETKERARTFF